MENISLELIILVIIVVLIVIAGVGIFMGSRISGDKKRIDELEAELKDAGKEMEAYRSEVNDHFRKTSDLFTNMTESYKAVCLHMVDGSQALCTSDAGLLKGTGSDFLKVVHEESSESPEDEHVSEDDQVARDPETKVETPEQPEQPELSGEEVAGDAVLEQVEAENLEGVEADVVTEEVSVTMEEGSAEETDPAETSEEKKDASTAGSVAERHS